MPRFVDDANYTAGISLTTTCTLLTIDGRADPRIVRIARGIWPASMLAKRIAEALDKPEPR